MDYRFSVTIDRLDPKTPCLTKHGNPCIRISHTWGLRAYDDAGERLEDEDITEISDGNLLTLHKDRLVYTRQRGWMGKALNRPSPALVHSIVEEIDRLGLRKQLLDYAISIGYTGEHDRDSVLNLKVEVDNVVRRTPK